ncbi:cell division protein FtsQ/DivIB [Nitratireductor luteus]|uniref:cell division protein FtsQ/DivIB n=1 Tax=Nitratireductor luteus TaxID=2976980 RepID=UPI00223F1A14|nr:cell division protein FtsQ/DivIB [Nitratireductor luteus]
MFALTSGRGSRAGESGFVLPRWLRRPVRLVQRLRIGDFDAPPFAATMATAFLFAATGLYGGLQGGHMDEVVQATTARVGFAIGDVRIAGNVETSEIDVLQQIGLDGWTSMVGFDVGEARERIAELPWVESATVRKVYPDTLEVVLRERKPFAIWQQGSRLSVIERDGSIIAPFTNPRHAALPLVLGVGASETAPDFIRKVAGVGGLGDRVRAYIRVADRRWDIRLDNGIAIKLPERDPDAALAAAARLNAQYQLFERDIKAVDLRLADRVTVALTEDAAEKRNAVIEQHIAARKKGARI